VQSLTLFKKQKDDGLVINNLKLGGFT